MGSLDLYIPDELLVDSDVETICRLGCAVIDTDATARIAPSMKACKLLVRCCVTHISANERVIAPAGWLGLRKNVTARLRTV